MNWKLCGIGVRYRVIPGNYISPLEWRQEGRSSYNKAGNDGWLVLYPFGGSAPSITTKDYTSPIKSGVRIRDWALSFPTDIPVGAALPETDTGFYSSPVSVSPISITHWVDCCSYTEGFTWSLGWRQPGTPSDTDTLDGLRRAIMKMTKVSRTSS